jgi:hypothetical protein
MTTIEALREKLYSALENGNIHQILEVSQKLDHEIVSFMRGYLNNKMMYQNTSVFKNIKQI